MPILHNQPWGTFFRGKVKPPKIAWGSDIFNRSGRDLKARSSAKLNSHTSSEGYSMSCPLLCTESETDPLIIRILALSFQQITLVANLRTGHLI